MPANSSPVSVRAARIPWLGLGAAAVVLILLTIYPPVRIVSLKAAVSRGAAEAAGNFEPAAFVAKFWSEQLQPAATGAPAAAPLLADFRGDPAGALQAHGRRVGLGNAAYYFAHGTGRITAVERSRLIVEVDGADGATVAIRTGPVFGNAVRDGCGLLEVNDVPGLAEFNALSAELNRIVEERVLPAIREEAAVGARIAFAGCAEAPESIPGEGPLLTFIPVHAEVTP